MHRVHRLRSVGASGMETEVCFGIWSADRVCVDIGSAEVCGGIGSANRGLRGQGVCRRIGSADQRPLSASGLQTEVYGYIVFGDRGLRGLLVCREMSAGTSGRQRDSAGGIGSAYSGQWEHQVCRQRSVQSSDLHTEVRWGHRVCRQRSVGALSMETEVCAGMVYRFCGGIQSADR